MNCFFFELKCYFFCWQAKHWGADPYELPGVNDAFLRRRAGNAFSLFVVIPLLSACFAAMRAFPETQDLPRVVDSNTEPDDSEAEDSEAEGTEYESHSEED